MTFGAQLRAARKRAKLTQAQAAEIAGVRQSHWSDIENDQVSPTLATADKMAHAVGASLGELLK